MRVRVLFFGVLREKLGHAEHVLDLDPDSRVSDLLRVLRSQTSASTQTSIPTMDALWSTLAVAVNREYASATHLLAEGDEVALLPPVSGGLR